jgi:hypothetical protein
MGLWTQVIGIGAALPDGLPTARGEDLAWLEPSAWSWATLTEDWERDLEEFAARVAEENAAPTLAFLIADSDLAVLYGSAPGERPVVASSGEYEEPGPPTTAEPFAEWTRKHAPKPVTPERFIEWSQTQYVFAEEGLADLLAEMGLVERSSGPAETLDA